MRDFQVYIHAFIQWKPLSCRLWLGVSREGLNFLQTSFLYTAWKNASEGHNISKTYASFNCRITGINDTKIFNCSFIYEDCHKHFIWRVQTRMLSEDIEHTSIVLPSWLYTTKQPLYIESSAPYTLLFVAAIKVYWYNIVNAIRILWQESGRTLESYTICTL